MKKLGWAILFLNLYWTFTSTGQSTANPNVYMRGQDFPIVMKK